MEGRALEYAFSTFLDVQVSRLFQAWLNSKPGRIAREKATIALNTAYVNNGSYLIGDFFTETKAVHRQMLEGNVQAEKGMKWKLNSIRIVLESDFMPLVPADVYLEVLASYLEANRAVHKNFSKEELDDIIEESSFN